MGAFIGTNLCCNIVKAGLVFGKGDLRASLCGAAVFRIAAIRAAWLLRATGIGSAIEVRLPDRTLAGTFEASDEEGEFFNEADAETVEMIKDLIETRVRPAVANDGGDITFRGFKDGIVYLNMKGSCAGCPSSTATLQHGIQNLLRHFVPDVVEVRPM